jgi:hypothetical protein
LLLLPQEAVESALPRPKSEPPAPSYPTPTGRVIVGAVLALGLYLGLRKVVLGAVMASQIDPANWWSSLEGLSAVCGVQVLAVIFGAMVAAAGRTGGLAYGGVIGGLCGGGFLAAELVAGAPPNDLVLYVQPVMLIAVGGIAGVLATRIWGAVPVLEMPLPRLKPGSQALELGEPEVPRPTAWLRILAGAMVMVAAIAGADRLRSGAQKYSAGMLRVTSVGQGQFLTWQLAVLGVLGGGTLAGAGTGAGIRHGVLAGLFGAVGVLALTAAMDEPLSPVSFWLRLLALGALPHNSPAAIVAAISGLMMLGVVGGWLGGTLFLPLAPEGARQRLRSLVD